MPSTCLLVLGTPRSGTSCVAGVLHHLGVPMGERLTPADEEWNPRGFYSDLEFEGLLIQAFDGEWVKRYQPLDGKNLDWLKNLVEVRSKFPLWGVKASRAALLLPQIMELCPVKVVRTKRTQSSSVNSWNARRSEGMKAGSTVVKAAENLIDEILSLTNVVPYEIDFNDLLADPSSTVTSLAGWVGVEVTDAAILSVEPDLRRF